MAERRPTILFVEDEFFIRLGFAVYLEDCGYEVLSATSADSAVQILEQGGVSFDLVLTDIRLPGTLDGFGLARWVRENRPGLPVILTSGHADQAEAAERLCKDVPFFRKPYDFVAVTARARALIEARNAG